MYEYELEVLPELEEEYEYEAEWEGGLDGEYESEEFFRGLARLAKRAARSPALRRVAMNAARSALGGLGLGESEYEDEYEYESEWEDQLSPIRPVSPDALMEHLGHAAARAQSEAEAEAFIGALIPLAARLLPRVAPSIMKAAPQLIKGASRVTRTLRQQPATRPLVRAMPTIVRRTAASMAKQAARGQPVTPKKAVRTLASQTAQVLSNPRKCVGAYQRSRALDKRFHRAARPAAVSKNGARR
jgi:hypothetical protein